MRKAEKGRQQLLAPTHLQLCTASQNQGAPPAAWISRLGLDQALALEGGRAVQLACHLRQDAPCPCRRVLQVQIMLEQKKKKGRRKGSLARLPRPLCMQKLLGLCQNPLDAACSFMFMHHGRSPYLDRCVGWRILLNLKKIQSCHQLPFLTSLKSKTAFLEVRHPPSLLQLKLTLSNSAHSNP